MPTARTRPAAAEAPTEPDTTPEAEAPDTEPMPVFSTWPEDKLMDSAISTKARIAVASRILEGVSKARHQPADGEQGVRYAYRGIEDVSSAVRAAFRQVGLFFRFDEDVVYRGEVQRGNKPWVHILMDVEWHVCSPADDDFRIGKIRGEGMDNSDKVHQKALTGSYKDALVKFLTIAADGEFEAESRQIPEQDNRPAAPPLEDMFMARGPLNEAGEELVTKATWEAILATNRTMTGPQRKELTSWREDAGIVVKAGELLEADGLRVLRKVADMVLPKEPGADATEEGTTGPETDTDADGAAVPSEAQMAAEGVAIDEQLGMLADKVLADPNTPSSVPAPDDPEAPFVDAPAGE
jgi:hypothetical protein